MAKYLLLKHYRGAPTPVNDVPMEKWTPEEISAHMQYMHDFAARLENTGEFVDGQALAPEGLVGPVRRRGPAAGHRRSVRRDQGPHRRLDGDRRRQPRARSRAGRRAVSRAGRGREADPRVARGAALPDRAAHHHRLTSSMDDVLLRSLTPEVLGVLVRRGADFAAAEDAVQDALVEAVRVWPADPPRDPKGWLITVAWRRFLDATRADAARRRRRTWSTRSRRRAPSPGSTTRSGSTSCARTRR